MPLYHTSCFSRHFCRAFVAAATLLIAFGGVGVQAATIAFPLDAEADPTSHFITYWSAGIAQLNLTYPGTNNQPFWNIDDLSQTYNENFDFFPNDSAMKFGELTYDDSSLVSGSGVATITGLTLGIERDPLDAGYVNGSWLSFTTDLETFSGSVDVIDDEVTGVNLTASYMTIGHFGGVLTLEGSGTFSIVSDQFQVLASASNEAILPAYDPAAAWNWTGTILNLADPPQDPLAGDYNGDGVVDSVDYALWWEQYGSAGPEADGNGDGTVDAADYTVWRDNYGVSSQTPSPSFAVPEPNAPTLLLAVLLGIGSGRQRVVGRSTYENEPSE